MRMSSSTEEFQILLYRKFCSSSLILVDFHLGLNCRYIKIRETNLFDSEMRIGKILLEREDFVLSRAGQYHSIYSSNS